MEYLVSGIAYFINFLALINPSLSPMAIYLVQDTARRNHLFGTISIIHGFGHIFKQCQKSAVDFSTALIFGVKYYPFYNLCEKGRKACLFPVEKETIQRFLSNPKGAF